MTMLLFPFPLHCSSFFLRVFLVCSNKILHGGQWRGTRIRNLSDLTMKHFVLESTTESPVVQMGVVGQSWRRMTLLLQAISSLLYPC